MVTIALQIRGKVSPLDFVDIMQDEAPEQETYDELNGIIKTINKTTMELVSGILLWLADVFGVKWVRQEPNKFRKVVKAITFLFVGIILAIAYFVVFG